MKRLKQLLEGLGRTVTRWLGIGAVGAAGVCGTLSLAAEPVPPSVPRETGLCLDRSPSMQGARFRAARQGAKLFINLLGDERLWCLFTLLRTVGFAGDAVTDEFRLKDGRSEAMKWIDHLEHAPCTDYGAALKACRWGDETPIIILGDGEQTIGSPQDVVDYVTNRLPRGVTLHTFAAGCQPGSEAERLLSRMAAMTGGSFAHIRDSEEMVRAFVETAIRVGNYRGCTPSEDVLEFDAASGRVVAFAYDGEVAFELDGKPLPPVVEYDAQLPGEDVQVRTVVLNAPGRLTVRLVNPRTKNSRLGTVLRTDKPRAELLIESHDGRVQPGSTVPAEILFEKRSGEEFDPRDTVEAEIELIDERGRHGSEKTVRNGLSTTVSPLLLSSFCSW